MKMNSVYEMSCLLNDLLAVDSLREGAIKKGEDNENILYIISWIYMEDAFNIYVWHRLVDQKSYPL